MADKLYISETPDEVKNAKGLHLITMNTPNGQAVQIFLEELAEAYGTTWTTTLVNIMTNEQKKECKTSEIPSMPLRRTRRLTDLPQGS